MKDRLKATGWQLWSLSMWVALTYAAIYGGSQGAANVVQFLAWALAVVSLCVLFTKADPNRIKGYIPALITRSIWAVMLFAYIWNGWWWTALALSIAWLFTAAYRLSCDDAAKKAAA